MTEFIVTVRATSITIFPGDEAMDRLERLLDILTYEDDFAEETKTLGYLYTENTNKLYLHKGVDLDYLRNALGNAKFIDFPCHRYEEMKFEYEEIIAPRNDEQADVINFICGQYDHKSNFDASQIFLVKAPGFGKAEPYSRKIPTPNGYKLMGDLEVGDYVFNRCGQPTKVVNIYEQGCIDVYKVIFNDKRIAFCAKEHLWTVHDSNRGSTCRLDELKEHLWTIGVSTYRLDELMEMDYTKYSIPKNEPASYNKKETKLDPISMGALLVYGDLDAEQLTIETSDPFIIKQILTNHPDWRGVIKDNKCVFLSEDLNPLKTDDVMSELYGSKRIPDNYLYNDIETREALLEGLLNYSIKDKRLTKINEHLLEDIKTLIYSLGFTIDFDINGNIVNFHVPNDDDLRIVNIEFSHTERCRCIMVDNDEHLYLTEDYIVTHNTYCSGVGLSKYKLKTLIIMHRDNLRKQWTHSLFTMSGYSSKDVYELADSQELYDIAHGRIKLDYDVYLMTHATFRAAANRIGHLEALEKITENLGIGMKIIDEAHLEFKDTLLMDAVMNVKRNLYLTATNGRSSKDENAIFRHVFSNAIFYKPSQMLTDNKPKKWVNYITVSVNTHCKPAIYQYRVVGGKGMNSASYGKWVIAYDKNHTHFKACSEILKNLFTEDPHAKVLVFMPLIDLCSDFQEFAYKTLSYDDSFDYDLDIRTINSHNSKSENEYNKKADVIVTTIASAGTGTDIPGITDIICCSPFVSRITAQQVFGRIRYIPKQCHYYDIYDTSVMMDKIWIKSRAKTLRPLALNYKNIEFVEEETK